MSKREVLPDGTIRFTFEEPEQKEAPAQTIPVKIRKVNEKRYSLRDVEDAMHAVGIRPADIEAVLERLDFDEEQPEPLQELIDTVMKAGKHREMTAFRTCWEIPNPQNVSTVSAERISRCLIATLECMTQREKRQKFSRVFGRLLMLWTMSTRSTRT